MVFTPIHDDEQRFVDFAVEIVQKAGTMVRLAFESSESKVDTKSSNTDLVTETDQAVEKLLIESLSNEFKDHRFIGEESVAGGAKIEWTDAPTWIIDPIDGTTNFVHRIPMIAICVGLAIKKQLRAGIVYNPITRELYVAQVGKGAFKNGFPIHASKNKFMSKAVLCQSLGLHNRTIFGDRWLDIAQSNMRNQVLAGVRGHRSFGSAAINMVMVAQGSCDGYVEYGVHAWDLAAAAVIVTEAGGVCMDPTGSPFNVMSRKVLCSGTPELAKDLSACLTHVDFEPEKLRQNMALPEEEVHMIIKQVLDETVGQGQYTHKDSVNWNQKAVENITKKLVATGKPYKYVVTSSFLQISSGSGLNVSTISYWNKNTDNSYMYRWETKTMLAIVYVFAIAI